MEVSHYHYEFLYFSLQFCPFLLHYFEAAFRCRDVSDSDFLLMNGPLYHYEMTFFFIPGSILCSDIYSDINTATSGFHYSSRGMFFSILSLLTYLGLNTSRGCFVSSILCSLAFSLESAITTFNMNRLRLMWL